jgi:transposase
VVNDEQFAVLRILVDRRRSLGEENTRVIPAHQLLLELILAVPRWASARQAKALLTRVRPRDAADKVRRRVAAYQRLPQREELRRDEVMAHLAE